MKYTTNYSSPLGNLLLVCNGEALTGLWMDTESPELGETESRDVPVFAAVQGWLDDYFRGMPRGIDFPLSPAGTAFQQQVWEILLTIPFGQTRSYGQIARQISPNMSAQAVGGAVGCNPISIIIPCHRVIGANGQLTGYAGGLDKKAWLLQHEEEHK